MKRNFLYEILQLPPEPLTRGLPPPDPCPLSSTEFVEPPHEHNSWVRHCLESIFKKKLTEDFRSSHRVAEDLSLLGCYTLSLGK